MVSPRISVSYPITDRGSIRFSYGHFFQIGSLSSLYSNPYYRAPQGTTPSFGNPDVNPQRGTQYEVGLQQALTENIGLYVDGYYKDVRDYISTQSILTARGDKSYNLLTNLSYANTRGISASLVKRNAPGDPFSATLDYTFQVAEVNRTEPSEEMFFNEQKGRLSETYLIPLGYDRSHTLTTTVTLIEPKDWVISLIGYVRTGTPYTPSFPSSVVAITFVQNSDRQPLQWNVDLKAEKYFTLGGLDFSIFLQVDNLFDTQNELYVYANSGRSLSNIETTTNPTRFNDLKSRINRGDPGLFPLSVLEHYYENPANVSGPRLVRIGASVLF
jgi:outer membrane receptor protein involved in Fe transport